MKRLAPLLLVAYLSACHVPAQPPQQPVTATADQMRASTAGQPLSQSVEAVADNVAAPTQQASAEVALAVPEATPAVQEAVAAVQEADYDRAAADLIVRWEIGSPAHYTRSLDRPIWPGGGSGITWGIGYDGGQQTAVQIYDDWKEHGDVVLLATSAGLAGETAHKSLARFRNIRTAYGYAFRVFTRTSLMEYERRTSRLFRNGYAQLRPLAKSALVSLVYKRGASVTGDNRREMRVLRDTCVPQADYGCMASQIRSMERLWRGTNIETGMTARREAEALLIETK